MEENSKTHNQHKKKGIIILGLIGVVGLIVGIFYYRYSQTHISTDDAYVAGSIYTLSFRVPGSVAKVMVHDNQLVEEGQVIAALDPTDYEVALKQALASLDSVKARLISAQIGVPLESEQAQARISESSAGKGAIEKTMSEVREQLKRAQEETKGLKAIKDKAILDRDRFDALFKVHAISKQQFDNALTQYHVAEAHYKAALAGEEALRNNIESFKDQITRAEAQVTLAQTGKQSVKIRQQTAKAAKSDLILAEARLEQARLQLSYTQIKAPTKGYITKKNIEVGNQIQAGQPRPPWSLWNIYGSWPIIRKPS